MLRWRRRLEMSSVPMSTEERVYARQVMREVKRREPIGAAAFKASSWEEGCMALFNRIERDGESAFTANAVMATRKRLEAIPQTDRGFALPRKNTFELITLTAGGHTLTVMEDLEEGVF